MIVAYISPDNATLRLAVQAVAGQKMTFRDPASFDPSQADPLDTVVYVSEHARAIRAAYARISTPALQMLSLEDSPLLAPMPVVGGMPLPRAPEVVEERLMPEMEAAVPAAPTTEPEAPSLSASSVGSTEPTPPGSPMPGQSRRR